MRSFIHFGVFAATLGSAGCGTLAFHPSVQSMGEYKNTQSIATEADEMSARSADGVKVLVETLPEGMIVKDNMIVVDPERYEMLGKVSADYKDASLVNMGFWFYDYKENESWRTSFCAWQVPLSWVTLTMWSWLSPTYYPCRVGAGSEEERRADIVQALQKATKALGGNLVVVSGFGGVDFVTTRGGTVVATNSVSNLKGVGYAFRVRVDRRPTSKSSAPPQLGSTRL